MPRLDINKQIALSPIRMNNAIEQIEKLGFEVDKINDMELRFEYKYKTVYFFPYSGWHSGKSIKEGRGLYNLLKQLK